MSVAESAFAYDTREQRAPATVTAPLIAREAAPGLFADASWPDLLVATDGTPAADGAVCVATRLAERQRLDAELLTVLQENAGLAAAMDAESRVRAQIRQFGASDTKYQIAIHSGSPAHTIARVANEHRVGMIVMGSTRYGVRALLSGATTMGRLLPLSDTPILVLPSFARYVPRRVVIATDFSMPSIRAARAAMEMVGDFTRIDLVYVEPQEGAGLTQWNRWEDGYQGGIRGAFDRLIHDLAVSPQQDLETWTLKGEVSSELLRFVERSACDLITAGGRHRGLLDRLSGRSVTRDLLHRAPCSLLIAPRRLATFS